MIAWQARTLTWMPVIGTAAAVNVAVIAARIGTGDQARAINTVVGLGSALLALSVGTAVDDDGAELVAATPTGLVRRRIPRIALVMAAAVMAWIELIVLASVLFPRSAAAIDTGQVALRSFAVAGATMAVAGCVGRRRRDHLAVAGAGAVAAAGLVGNWADLGRFLSSGGWALWAVGLAGLAITVAASREPLPR